MKNQIIGQERKLVTVDRTHLFVHYVSSFINLFAIRAMSIGNIASLNFCKCKPVANTIPHQNLFVIVF